MKKTVLALAALAAFAGSVSAQTNVTIYGTVDTAVERADTNATRPVWSLTDVNQNSYSNGSRLGFKGKEDLGGGLSAIFTLENGFALDDGRMSPNNRLFGRQAFVGLQGGFGAVKLGLQYTPMFIALDTIDPFNQSYAGAIGRLFNNAGIRTDNTINYSLSAAGFSGQLAYTLGEQATGTSDARQLGLGLGYANGPINVQFAYHDANGNPASTADAKTALVGGSYDLGVAKVHAAFQTDKVETGAATTTKDRNWMLGVSAPVGVGRVMASFVRNDDRLIDANTDQYALGYVHNLSKRTNVYTSYARQNDKSALNADNDRFNVGVQHRF